MNRVAIVTGAARGIGAASVHRLVADGWRVIAVDRCQDDPAVPYQLATAAQLQELGERYPDQVHCVVADVRDQQALRGAVQIAVEKYGALHAAVAGAGVILGGKPLWKHTDEEISVLLDICLRGVINLAAVTIEPMLQAPQPREGRFVAIASAAAHHGLWHLAAYNAAKHAVFGLIKGLAADLRGTGINATAVSPGSTDTAMLAATATLYGLAHADQLAGHQLVERLLDPHEVASVIAWLCSARSSAITGSVVHADGGFTG